MITSWDPRPASRTASTDRSAGVSMTTSRSGNLARQGPSHRSIPSVTRVRRSSRSSGDQLNKGEISQACTTTSGHPKRHGALEGKAQHRLVTVPSAHPDDEWWRRRRLHRGPAGRNDDDGHRCTTGDNLRGAAEHLVLDSGVGSAPDDKHHGVLVDCVQHLGRRSGHDLERGVLAVGLPAGPEQGAGGVVDVSDPHQDAGPGLALEGPPAGACLGAHDLSLRPHAGIPAAEGTAFGSVC